MSTIEDQRAAAHQYQRTPKSSLDKLQGTLFIEVKLVDDANDDPFVDIISIERDVLKSLDDDFAQVKIGTLLDMSGFWRPLSYHSLLLLT